MTKGIPHTYTRVIGRQKSFSLFEDQYYRLEEIAIEKNSRSFISDIVRRGVDLALEEYEKIVGECKENDGKNNK